MRLALCFDRACAGLAVRRTALFIAAAAALSACNQEPAAPAGTAATASQASQVPPAGVSPPIAPSSPGAQPAAPQVSTANEEKVKELLAAAKGKTLVVNVWATFCIPCIEEMPELAQFYTARDPNKVAFLSLSADPGYSIEDAVKPFAVEKKLPFPVYVLQSLPPDRLAEILGVTSTGWSGELPATFILDANGALKKAWLERVHLEDLNTAVKEAG